MTRAKQKQIALEVCRLLPPSGRGKIDEEILNVCKAWNDQCREAREWLEEVIQSAKEQLNNTHREENQKKDGMFLLPKTPSQKRKLRTRRKKEPTKDRIADTSILHRPRDDSLVASTSSHENHLRTRQVRLRFTGEGRVTRGMMSISTASGDDTTGEDEVIPMDTLTKGKGKRTAEAGDTTEGKEEVRVEEEREEEGEEEGVVEVAESDQEADDEKEEEPLKHNEEYSANKKRKLAEGEEGGSEVRAEEIQNLPDPTEQRVIVSSDEPPKTVTPPSSEKEPQQIPKQFEKQQRRTTRNRVASTKLESERRATRSRVRPEEERENTPPQREAETQKKTERVVTPVAWFPVAPEGGHSDSAVVPVAEEVKEPVEEKRPTRSRMRMVSQDSSKSPVKRHMGPTSSKDGQSPSPSRKPNVQTNGVAQLNRLTPNKQQKSEEERAKQERRRIAHERLLLAEQKKEHILQSKIEESKKKREMRLKNARAMQAEKEREMDEQRKRIEGKQMAAERAKAMDEVEKARKREQLRIEEVRKKQEEHAKRLREKEEAHRRAEAKRQKEEEEKKRIEKQNAEYQRIVQKEKEREALEKKNNEEERKAAKEAKKKQSSSINESSSGQRNTSILSQASTSASEDSYEMTPARKVKPSTDENYDITDLRSDDETDEEGNPKKKIPYWAQGAQLKASCIKQHYTPPDLDVLFGPICEPELGKIFRIERKRFRARTSSALWDSPLLKHHIPTLHSASEGPPRH